MVNVYMQKKTRPFLIALVVIAFIGVIYSGLWLVLAISMKEQAVNWIAKQSDHGLKVHYDQLVLSGFPFAVCLEVRSPVLRVSNTFLPWGWEGETLRVITQLWNKNRFQFELSGRQILALERAKEIRKFSGEIKQARGQFVFSEGKIRKAKIAFRGVLLIDKTRNATISMKRAELFLQRLKRTEGDQQAANWSLYASGENLTFPFFKVSPLSNKLGLILKARLVGDVENKFLVKSLENWRDNGGKIELEKLNAEHGPLKIHAEGTLALDNKLQPIGTLTAHLEGFYETIDALNKLGLVKARNAITAKVLMGVLSRTPVVGGPPVLNLAITAQNQNLYLGPVRLLQLPEVNWH